jgi:hypothetical protein
MTQIKGSLDVTDISLEKQVVHRLRVLELTKDNDSPLDIHQLLEIFAKFMVEWQVLNTDLDSTWNTIDRQYLLYEADLVDYIHWQLSEGADAHGGARARLVVASYGRGSREIGQNWFLMSHDGCILPTEQSRADQSNGILSVNIRSEKSFLCFHCTRHQGGTWIKRRGSTFVVLSTSTHSHTRRVELLK